MFDIRVLFLFIFFPFFSVSAQSFEYDLTFVQPWSAYTANIQLESQARSHSYIVDTGSSAIVVNTEQRTDADMLTANIILPGNNPTLKGFKINLFQKTEHKSNLLGLLPDSAFNNDKKSESQFSNFPNRVQKRLPNIKTFTLQLCNLKGKSKLYFGKLPKRYDKYQSFKFKIIEKTSGAILLNAIGTKAKPRLFDYKDKLYAVIDSGMTGAIEFPVKYYNELLSYIFDNTNTSNQALGDGWWRGDVCVPQAQVTKSAFPDLYFMLTDIYGSSIRLKLPKDKYVSNNGCRPGWLRFAFKPRKKLSQKAVEMGVTDRTVLIGTPLIEQYSVTFPIIGQDYIEFHDNGEQICLSTLE